MAGATIFIALLLSALCYFPKSFFSDGTLQIVEIVLWMILACIVSYVKPCKSAVANISLSVQMTIYGILMCLIYLWEFDLLVETDTLELSLSFHHTFWWLCGLPIP